MSFCQTTVKESVLFEHLINVWEFKPGHVPGTCDLYFLVDFKFQSPLYRQVYLFHFNFYFLPLSVFWELPYDKIFKAGLFPYLCEYIFDAYVHMPQNSCFLILNSEEALI